MISLRYRLLQRLDFAIGFLVIWAFGVLIFWRLWGSCIPLPVPSCSDFPITAVGSDEIPVKGPVTPVYIVEEHHEVLLYWFDAAEKGLINRQGNVLLHIDGHSDAATPERRDVLPLFRWPSVREIYNMMQRNDVFIVGAAFTGLVRRYIWVWSPWDETRAQPALADHHILNVKRGTVTRRDLNGTMIEDICVCLKAETKAFDLPPGDNCVMANLTNPYTDDGEIEISTERCKIEIDDAIVEVVSEAKAIELMKSGKWITSHDSVILDIDEDYYGCEAAVQPLYDVKVKERMILWVKYYVSRLFCPSQAREELEADKFFARLLDMVINLKRFCQKMGNSTSLCKNDLSMKEYMLKSTEVLFVDITQRNLWPILCRSDKTAKKAISRLVKNVFPFTIEQLNVMKDIGICFYGSPRTLTYEPILGMRTCDGYNRPNDSVVPFHTPTPDEVTFRTSQLKVMLSSEGLHPGVVTVCRSMRDGYTPRKFFHRIEKDVLGVLKDVFSSIDDTSIFYDPYLLGGASGWPGRH